MTPTEIQVKVNELTIRAIQHNQKMARRWAKLIEENRAAESKEQK